jgi:hypothetical protein
MQNELDASERGFTIGPFRSAEEVAAEARSLPKAIRTDNGVPFLSEGVLAAMSAGIIEMDGKPYMRDPKGRLVPAGLVKPEHALEDQAVRKIVAYAQDISRQVARFKGHTVDDVVTFVDLLDEKYDGARGGAKGNTTLTSYDGCQKVVVQVQDIITFGPELQVAKGLVDQCVTLWAEGADEKIRALVEHAFQVDKEGKINRSALIALRRLDIDDADWRRAMEALADAMRSIGTREYLRFYSRPDSKAKWVAITVDLAAAAP